MSDRDPLALAERYGPYALLALVVVFMFWVRMLPVDRVIADSAVFYSGNDPWYHNRMVHYAVRHFPETTPFDPWSYFPYGTGRHSGFGGLFDQLIALAALIVGLGSPSDRTIDVVTAIAPPVFGAITAIPTYVIAKRVTGRWGGVLAAGLLALSGGGILSRTIVGTADHQSAEAFFGAVAVAGFAFAVATAYRESPVFEDVTDREWRYLRTPTLAGIAGGVAVAAYLTMWPPGVMLLFTFGVFVVVQLAREHYTGQPTDHLAIATVVSMVTTGILTLIYARTYTLNASAFSLLQPLVAFGLAAGTTFLFWLSRYAEREGYPRGYYPPTVVGLILASFVLVWAVFPTGIDMLEALFVRVYSFGYLTSQSAGTVAEIQPATPSNAFDAYGLVLIIALVGAVLLVYRVRTRNRPVDLLVLLWSASMFAAYFTMARFGYYFSVVVAILAALGIWWVVEWLDVDVDVEDLRSRDGLRNADVGMYQVIALLVVLVLVVPGNVVAMSGQQPVWERAEHPALSGTDEAWYDGMSWMESNTPAVPMGYYEQYEPPADGDYDYPADAYGVMSWWDYGHWITVMGDRVPYANPFQEGPRPASAYFQATNETRAELILEALPSLSDNSGRVADMSTDELQNVVSEQSDQAATEDGRYVVIDDQMAGGKFPAITQWTGPGPQAYFQNGRYQFQGQNVSLPETSDRYDRTMLSRLYYQDARGLSHYRLVHEVDRYSLVGGYVQGQRVRALTSLRLNGGWENVSQTAGQLEQAHQSGQMVSIGGNQFVYNARVESSVKTYERVEGATLTGTAPEAQNGTPVFAVLQLQTEVGRNFTYVQQATTGRDGSFSMTVPYATDDTIEPAQGGTDSSVVATGDYDVFVGLPFAPSAQGSTPVPEEAVYEGQSIEVQVEPTQRGNESTGNGTTAPGNESAVSDGRSTATGNETGTSDEQPTEAGDVRIDGLVAETAEPSAKP